MERRLGWAVQGRPPSDGELDDLPAVDPSISAYLRSFNIDLGPKGGLGVFLIGKGSGFDRAVPVVRELGI